MDYRISTYIKIRNLALVILLLTISIASAMDFHADCSFHDNCPLCRFQMDSGCDTIPVLSAAIQPLLTQTVLTIKSDSFILKAFYLIANPSNAPPTV